MTFEPALVIPHSKPKNEREHQANLIAIERAINGIVITVGGLGGVAGGVLSGTFPNPGFAVDMTTQAEFDAFTAIAATDAEVTAAVAAHTGDTSAAHAASAISADSATLVGVGTDVQAVLEELDNGIADHLADTSDAHDASAISFSATGTIAATDVQAAIAEVASEAIPKNLGGSVADGSIMYYDTGTAAWVERTIGSGSTFQILQNAAGGPVWDWIDDENLSAGDSTRSLVRHGASTPPATMGGTIWGRSSVERLDAYNGSGYTRVIAYGALGRTGGSWTRAANQSITNNTVTDVSWDTEAYDSDTHLAHHATTGITWTCKIAGVYSCDVTVNGLDNATRAFCQLIYNGATFRRQNGVPGDATNQQLGFACKPLAVNDTIKIQVYQNSGGAKNLTGSWDIYRYSA